MTAARVLEVARGELGTVEQPHGSNRQPYGAAYGWNGVAWCAQFVWWVLTRAGCGPLVPKTASTVVMRDWYRARGQWHTSNPRPGDLVFFKFPGNNNPVNHVGIVEAVEPGGTLICIEGNTAGTAAGDQRNGGGVYRKRRIANIVGFGRPAYTAAPARAAAPTAPPLRKDNDPVATVPLTFYRVENGVWIPDPAGLEFRGSYPAEAGRNSAVVDRAFVRWSAHWGRASFRVVAWDARGPIDENDEAVKAGLDHWELPRDRVRSFTVEGRRERPDVEVGASLITLTYA